MHAGSAWENNDLVFCDEAGGPLHPNAVSAAFKSILQSNGLPPIRLHDLRHGCATMALQQGVPAKIVSERLGHSSVAFTLDTYSHVLPEMQVEAAERVAQLLR
jgi:integrase